MAKNLMPEVAKMLGVELGEEFIIENEYLKETVVLNMDGLTIIRPNDEEWGNSSNLLAKVLQGLYKVEKLPWEPKHHESYYRPNIISKAVANELWNGATLSYALKALGMIYRTKAEAEAHLAEDYEKLTGKPLSSR